MEENNEYIHKYKVEVEKKESKETNHVKYQSIFIENHYNNCYEFHSNFLTKCGKDVVLFEGTSSSSSKKLREDTSVSINFSIQTPEFMKQLLVSTLPYI